MGRCCVGFASRDRSPGGAAVRASMPTGGCIAAPNDLDPLTGPRPVGPGSGLKPDGAVEAPSFAQQEWDMTEDGRERFEIPKEMRSMAEVSFEQARQAFEKFVSTAQQTAGTIEECGASVRAGAKHFNAKAMSYAEKNVQASLDYAQSLLQAKDMAEIMRLHTEYVQAQMRSLAEQASEMGQIVSRAAMDAATPKG